MGDFEDRLSRALTDGAENVSGGGVAGLAEGARGRLRRRRGRGIAVGVAAAVAAVVVPLTLLGSGGDPSPAPPTVVDGPRGGWKTVEVEIESQRSDEGLLTVLVDVPEAWAELADDAEGVCSFYAYGLTSDDGCREFEVMGVRTNLTADYLYGAGLRPASDYERGRLDAAWIGHVSLGSIDVNVASDDQQTALRVLGSARLEGQEIPDLAGEWPEFVDQGVSYRAPALDDPYGVQLIDRGKKDEYAYGEQVDDDLWVAAATVGDHRVEAFMPTQALAELVAGSARVAEVTTPEPQSDEWQQVSDSGATFEVPVDWTSPPACDGAGPARPTFGPGATPHTDCRDVPGVFVYASALFDPAYGPGIQECESSGWCGYVIAGPAAVFVRGVERAVAVHVLDSVRSDEPVSGEEWRTVTYADLDLDLPPGFDEQDPAVCGREVGYEAGIMVPFSGLDPCRASPRLTVQGEAAIDFETGLYEGGGGARIGNQAVFVANVDRAMARRVLASVRPAGTALPDLTVWTTVTQDGVTVEVPADGSVEVVVRSGVPRCSATVSEARPVADDRWAADWCRNRIVTILAPTEALAEVVAATIRD